MRRFFQIFVCLVCMESVGTPVKSMIASDGTSIINQESLPYDHEVEFIESTGTQYIDTGILSSNHYRIGTCPQPEIL